MIRPAMLPIVLGAGVLALSTASIFIRLCDDAPPVIIAAARMSLATLVLLAGASAAGRLGELKAALPHWRGLGLAGLFLAAHFFFWMTSLRHTSVLSSVVIVTSNPIFVGIASYFLFGERLSAAGLAAIGLAIVGGGLIVWSDSSAGGEHLYGDLMALFGVLTVSAYWMTGRRLRQRLDNLVFMIAVCGVAAVALLAYAVAGGHGFGGYRWQTYVYFVLLAIVPQIIGHGAMNWGLRYVSATTVTLFILGEPVGSAILARWLLGESISESRAAGSGLILAGVLLVAARGGGGRPAGPPPASST